VTKPEVSISSFKKLPDWIIRLERNTSVVTNPGLSLVHLSFVKIRILTEYVYKRVLHRSTRRKSSIHMIRIDWRRKSDIALVLGNGPATAHIDFKKVEEWQQKSRLDVYVVNQFVSSEIFRNGFEPNFLVLSDPIHRPTQDRDITQIWNDIDTASERMQIVVPQNWFNDIVRYQSNLLSRCHFFDDVSLEGFSRNIHPSKARGYLQFTAFKALAVACSKGYDEIGICGIDNSMFKGLSVDANNRILQGSNHLKGTEDADSDVTPFYPNGVADYFHLVSLQFLTLKRCFSSYPIKNLDPNSLVDSFDKGNLSIDVKLVE
jgi:hypothetical protein